MPTRDWFSRPVLEVARDLLGARFTHRTAAGSVTVRLVEVEAYDGENDPASHAFRGPTKRNASMFGEAGHLYVYRHLGLHFCVNIVTSVPGHASGILLRAGEVIAGVDLARSRRAAAGVTRSDRDLAQGPARLTVALGITAFDDGADLLDPGSAFTLKPNPLLPDDERIVSGPRIGVTAAGSDPLKYPWRFYLQNDPHISHPRATPLVS